MGSPKEVTTAVETPQQAKAKPAAPADEQRGETSKYRGLCSNCDWRETCLYRSDGVAVWYCEEYQ